MLHQDILCQIMYYVLDDIKNVMSSLLNKKEIDRKKKFERDKK